jgi:hypothetical protein
MSLRTRHRRPGRLPGWARGVVPGPWLALLVALVLTATLGPAVPCRAAGLDNEAPNGNAAPGSSGWFDGLLDRAPDGWLAHVLGPRGRAGASTPPDPPFVETAEKAAAL